MKFGKYSSKRVDNVLILAGFGLFIFVILGMRGPVSCGSEYEEIRIRSFSPYGQVERTTNMTVEFSKDVVGDSSLRIWVDEAPLSIEPQIPGRFQWISRNRLRFYPEVELAPSTKYTAEIPRMIESTVDTTTGQIRKYEVEGQRKYEFYTERFKVDNASLRIKYDESTNEKVSLYGTIRFNYEVDVVEAAKHISLRYVGGGELEYEMQTTEPSDVIAIEADNVRRGEERRQVRLKISKGMIPIGGSEGLFSDYIEPLEVPRQEDLRVERMIPVMERRSRHIRIEFNIPISASSAGEFISVDSDISYRVEVSHKFIDLRGGFETGKSYNVTIRQGLRAIDGTELKKGFRSAVNFRGEDIPPQIDFVGEGFYLSRKGNLDVGLSTINIEDVSLTIEKVYTNNLLFLLNSSGDLAQSGRYRSFNLNALGKRIHEAELEIESVRNDEVVTPINVREYIGGKRIGIYHLSARSSDRRWVSADRWVVATDLGITAKEAGGELWVWVNSLTSLEPITGAEVTLVSRNNQTLMESSTNGEGISIFRGYKDEIGDFTPYIITVKSGDDISFVELSRRRIQTSDFKVGGGAYLIHGYEAFVYNDRDIYRPGETAHLAVAVRGEEAAVPQSFPIKMTITSSDGRIFNEQRANLNDGGVAEFTLPIPAYSLTGKYTAVLSIGEKKEIGRAEFFVEEFMPDRMKVRISTERESYKAGDTVELDVHAVTLFGPPAAKRRVQAKMELTARTFSPPGWESFTFSDRKKSFSKVNIPLKEGVTDDEGRYVYRIDIPKKLTPPSSLRGEISATVLEPGGRGVTDRMSVTIHPYDAYVGLKKKVEGYAEPNMDTPMQFVVLNPDGEPAAGRQAEVTFYRVYWQSVLRRVDKKRGYRYTSEKVEQEITKFKVTSSDEATEFFVNPRGYGRYLVVVRDVASGASASVSFYASGWGYVPWAMEQPDRIDLDLEKELYLPGETARVQVKAPFPGRLLMTVERGKIFSHEVITLDSNTAVIEIPIREEYKPNVYISAQLVRSMESLERDTPVRAFGVVPLKINTEMNRLNVNVEIPDEIRPETSFTVNYEITGQSERDDTYLTIAAVDEGICQLTGFETPDPHGYFFGKKRLSVVSYDIYGVMLPEILAFSSSSGDRELQARRQKMLTPVTVRRVKPVALWSGIVKADRRGRGKVKFDVPEFNGSLRIMVVAFSGDEFGGAEENLFVRAPIVLTPTIPRFIAGTDAFTIPVSVYNGTGSDAEFDINLKVEGRVNVTGEKSQRISVAQTGEEVVYFKLKAENAWGEVKFILSAVGGGEEADVSVDVPMRPAVPFTVRSGSGVVKEGEPAKFTFPSGWVENTEEFHLTLASFPTVEFGRSLQYLLRYPYGCIEQTTSRVFPLLYFDELAQLVEPELFKINSADYYIEEGIAKIENHQVRSGDFLFWQGGRRFNNWSTVYAAHFLVEARRKGYVVSGRVYNRMIGALRKITRSYRERDSSSYHPAAYASYVLALAGKPEKSTMLYLKNNSLNRLSAYSQALLAGAFAHSGDMSTARSMLPQTAIGRVHHETGVNFNSSVRSKAIMLDIFAEVDETSPMVPFLVKDLTGSAGKYGRWSNTQENAFALLALGKIMQKQEDSDYSGNLKIDGDNFDGFDEEGRSFSDKSWAGKEVDIDITGSGNCYYFWRAEGVPSELNIEEFDSDLIVRRVYLDANGKPVDYTKFRQGDLIIAEISVKPKNEDLRNVAIVDMLPAGFEIENPRLQSRETISWVGKNVFHPEYMDIRDDRLILFGHFRRGLEQKFYYGLRAVTAGEFILPPVRAEAMYAPAKSSVSSSGRVKVLGLEEPEGEE